MPHESTYQREPNRIQTQANEPSLPDQRQNACSPPSKEVTLSVAHLEKQSHRHRSPLSDLW